MTDNSIFKVGELLVIADKMSGCTGCTACYAVCPTDAIEMKPNKQGFIYPNINSEMCMECGLCNKTCSLIGSNKNSVIIAYAVRNNSNAVLKKSSSGGASHALCKSMIQQGGVVYGVVYTPDYKVITRRATTLEECEAFHGSKYVQSNPSDTFSQVCTDLNKGISVLYFGTSCHIDGLLCYLNIKGSNTDKLVTVDLICHGVPSPKLFSEYIGYINKNNDFFSYDFRTKKLPWGNSEGFGSTISYLNGKQEVNTDKARLFLNLFNANLCLRPACYNCKYTGERKPADITIADYWGISEEHPDFYCSKGVSALLIHSHKGEDLFNSNDALTYIESTVDKIKKQQINLNRPSIKGKHYDAFWNCYYKKGFEVAAKKYGKLSYKKKTIKIMKKIRLYNILSAVKKIFKRI